MEQDVEREEKGERNREMSMDIVVSRDRIFVYS